MTDPSRPSQGCPATTVEHSEDRKSAASAIDRYRRYLLAELEAAYLYEGLANAERNSERASILRELAAIEQGHAARWKAKLQEAGVPLPAWRPTPRSLVLRWLARLLGDRTVLPILERLEGTDADMYALEPEAQDLSVQERAHARIFARLVGSSSLARPNIALAEGRHRGAGGGSLRAAVFGVNDGLVSNLSLVMGVAGADVSAQMVLLAGFAGMLAGAFSMATGEYISMQTQRELLEREIDVERAELEADPEEEVQELALIYRAKGLARDEADQLARKLIANKATALDTLAREELGLDPGDLGSPWRAAASSFLAFATGAFIPVLPYLLADKSAAFVASAVLSALALAAVGAATGLLAGRPMALSSTRMLLFGGAASTVTFFAGRLLGIASAL